MTPEQLLLAAVSGLTTALVWAVTKLWTKAENCEKDRATMAVIMRDQGDKMAYMKATLDLLKACQQPGCPYTAKHKDS